VLISTPIFTTTDLFVGDGRKYRQSPAEVRNIQVILSSTYKPGVRAIFGLRTYFPTSLNFGLGLKKARNGRLNTPVE
jgi:hypothetical protein